MAVILASTSFFSVFSSGIFSAAVPIIARNYNVGHVVATLGVSFFVFGFAVGPLVWAPLSELRGRKLPLSIAMFGFSIFQVGVATGENLQTILICRFFAGKARRGLLLYLSNEIRHVCLCSTSYCGGLLCRHL